MNEIEKHIHSLLAEKGFYSKMGVVYGGDGRVGVNVAETSNRWVITWLGYYELADPDCFDKIVAAVIAFSESRKEQEHGPRAS